MPEFRSLKAIRVDLEIEAVSFPYEEKTGT
jgi:hypothetical protein